MNAYGGGEHEKDKGYRMFIGQDKAFESARENASKLARAYPELNFSHYLTSTMIGLSR